MREKRPAGQANPSGDIYPYLAVMEQEQQCYGYLIKPTVLDANPTAGDSYRIWNHHRKTKRE